MRKKFDGKVVLVTGASSGLGEWISRGFVKEGANVIVTSHVLKDCEEAAERLSMDGTAIPFKMDVTVAEDRKAALEMILERYGQIDVLVNNAGLVLKKKALEIDEEFFEKMNDVNVKGAFFCSQLFGEQMIKQQHGKIINITSAAGKLIRKGLANPIYNMNKGAINMMTKALAEEWAEHNINVNALGPGYFETPPVRERLKDEATKKSVLDSTPLGRIGREKDIAGTALFLASEEASFITGQILYVDGGRTIL